MISLRFTWSILAIILNIKEEISVWSTLLFDHDFAAILKDRVQAWDPTMDMRLDPRTCNAYRTTSLRYQSTFVITHRSLTGIGPYYQARLDLPKIDPFPTPKPDRQHPMLKFERQIAVYGRYHSTLYNQGCHIFLLIDIFIIIITIIHL